MKTKQELLLFLKESDLFSGFSENEISLILPFVETKTYAAGDVIFEEGERAQELYLIASGEVEVVKKDQLEDGEHRLAILNRNEWFGEMTIFTDRYRSASIRALKITEVVKIPIEELDQLAKANPSSYRLILNLGKKINERLKETNTFFFKALQEKLSLYRTHDMMGQFIIHLFILLTLYFYTVKVVEQYGIDGFFKEAMTSILILSFAVSAILLVQKNPFPLSFYGLTLNRWKQHLFEGVVFTLPILVLMLFVKWALIHFTTAFAHYHLFAFGPQDHTYLYFFHTTEPMGKFLLGITIYSLLVPVQEFLTRGCLQKSFENFFRSPRRVFLAILTSNLLFGMFHGLKTFSFAGCAFLLGIFWGWLFHRQQSIVGASTSHILVGIWAFGCLNYQSILIY